MKPGLLKQWLKHALTPGIALGVLSAGGLGLASPAAARTAPVTNPGSGEIRVVYRPVKSAFANRWGEVYQKSKLFETAVAPLNANFVLPRDLTVEVAECGFVNAFYEPSKHRIVVCYDLTAYLVKTFRSAGMSTQEAELQALNATVFTFYHEMAHMLIGELDLPVTGKEEDVADQFSALLLSNAGDSGQGAILAAAQWFGSSKSSDSRVQYMDEHSLNEQRAYYLICLLHAKQPEKLGRLVRKLGFKEERLAKCELEYRQISRSWGLMMTPYLRQKS
jgi:hypothetical protein